MARDIFPWSGSGGFLKDTAGFTTRSGNPLAGIETQGSDFRVIEQAVARASMPMRNPEGGFTVRTVSTGVTFTVNKQMSQFMQAGNRQRQSGMTRDDQISSRMKSIFRQWGDDTRREALWIISEGMKNTPRADRGAQDSGVRRGLADSSSNGIVQLQPPTLFSAQFKVDFTALDRSVVDDYGNTYWRALDQGFNRQVTGLFNDSPTLGGKFYAPDNRGDASEPRVVDFGRSGGRGATFNIEFGGYNFQEPTLRRLKKTVDMTAYPLMVEAVANAFDGAEELVYNAARRFAQGDVRFAPATVGRGTSTQMETAFRAKGSNARYMGGQGRTPFR